MYVRSSTELLSSRPHAPPVRLNVVMAVGCLVAAERTPVVVGQEPAPPATNCCRDGGRLLRFKVANVGNTEKRSSRTVDPTVLSEKERSEREMYSRGVE